MTILKVHNYYQQGGGEDQTLDAEVDLLESHGHHVIRCLVHNNNITRTNLIGTAVRTIWSRPLYRRIYDLVQAHRPQVVHFHNTFPLVSPAGYYAARRAGAAVVQSLHNYRLICPNGLFYRQNRPCEECLGKCGALPAIRHRCYHGIAGSATVAAMLAWHHGVGTYRNSVDRYITMTQFSFAKFVAGGLPAEKIVIKPHFLSTDPGPGPGDGGYAVFVGRLSAEKGVDTLLQAWMSPERPSIPLKIVGDGPLAPAVANAAANHPQIEWLGKQPVERVQCIIHHAAFLVFPSGCYETFGRAVIEAFASGTPVLISNAVAIAELVDPGRTGERFVAGDSRDLARQARTLISNPNGLLAMRAEARREFVSRFTADKNYQSLMGVYNRAIAVRKGREDPATGCSPPSSERRCG
jgi:glycosyltransferase involved in cell wall biosynthesis